MIGNDKSTLAATQRPPSVIYAGQQYFSRSGWGVHVGGPPAPGHGIVPARDHGRRHAFRAFSVVVAILMAVYRSPPCTGSGNRGRPRQRHPVHLRAPVAELLSRLPGQLRVRTANQRDVVFLGQRRSQRSAPGSCSRSPAAARVASSGVGSLVQLHRRQGVSR